MDGPNAATMDGILRRSERLDPPGENLWGYSEWTLMSLVQSRQDQRLIQSKGQQSQSCD